MRSSPTREQRGAITALYLDTLYIEVLVAVYKSVKSLKRGKFLVFINGKETAEEHPDQLLLSVTYFC